MMLNVAEKTENQTLTENFEVICNNGTSYNCHAGDTLLTGALRARLGLAYECNAGGCGSCKVILESGEVEDRMPHATGIKERERQRGKILACQCVPKSPCSISFKEDAESIPIIVPKLQEAIFLGSRQITHDLREFSFKVAEKMSFIAGQYALLSLPGMFDVRSYSMSNLENDEGIVQFIIRRVTGGTSTEILFDKLEPGEKCQIDGPYSSAYLRNDNSRPIICIAGGSGLAPMLSVIRGALASRVHVHSDLYFYYGGREPKDIFDRALFEELKDNPRIHLVTSVSCEFNETTEWQGQRGFIHECVEKDLANRFQESEFYIAGPPPMVDAVRRMLLLQHQVPAERLHYDRFF